MIGNRFFTIAITIPQILSSLDSMFDPSSDFEEDLAGEYSLPEEREFDE